MLQTCFASVSVGKDETLDGFFVDVVQTRHAGTVGLRNELSVFSATHTHKRLMYSQIRRSLSPLSVHNTGNGCVWNLSGYA